MLKVYTALMFCCLLACTSRKKTPPNILFIFTDDQAYNTIAELGNPEIHTPNLDKLVRGGTTFTHAYNMGAWHPAICIASRTMLNSGRGVFQARATVAAWEEGQEAAIRTTWGPLMQSAGYDTYFSGKWHIEAPLESSFDTITNLRGGMPWDKYPFQEMMALRARHGDAPPRDSVLALFPPGYNRPLSEDDASWDPTDTQYEGYWAGGQHWSEVLADDAVNYLNQAAKDADPFFMYLAFNAPHDPRQAPREFQDLYDASELSLPDSYLPDYPYATKIGNGPGLRDEDLAPFPRTELAVRTHKKEYYAAISHLDAQVGRILAGLEASGKADNTVIIFTADHGLALGNHGLLGKQNMYDHSVRVPLVLVGPDIPIGTKVATDVYLQDVMPTALELAGVEKPATVFYNSLLPYLRGEDLPGPYPAIFGAYVDYQRSIRTEGKKLIAYPDAGVLRLYDLVADPFELRDLAGVDTSETKRLFGELQALQLALGDGLVLEWEDFAQ